MQGGTTEGKKSMKATRSEIEHEIRCAWSGLRGGDAERDNALDGLVEAGFLRADRIRIVTICDYACSSEAAVTAVFDALSHLRVE